MPCRSKTEKYECCGKTFETKEEYEAEKKGSIDQLITNQVMEDLVEYLLELESVKT